MPVHEPHAPTETPCPGRFDGEDGHVDIPSDPGLGIEIDEAALRLQEVEDGETDDAEDEESSVWRHPDGSVAEW